MKAHRHASHCLALVAALCLSPVTGRAGEDANLGALISAGRYDDAQVVLERQLRTNPQDLQLRLYKGVIQRETGHPADALATFTRLSEEHPELPEPYNNAAVIYAAQGQYDKARIALEKALRTNASYAAAHDNLAEVYARLASQAYGKALQIDAPPPAPSRLALLRELHPAMAGASTSGGITASTRPAPPAMTAVATVPSPAPSHAAAPIPAPSSATVAIAQVPAPRPAASAVKAPAAAPSATVNPAANDASREVEHALRVWAQAWSDRNMGAYFNAYEKTYTGGLVSHAAWEEERRSRILGKSRISVGLSGLQIHVTGNRAVAKFRQSYKADRLSVQGPKTLEFVRSGDRWLIARELTGS